MDSHEAQLANHEDRIERIETRQTAIEDGGQHYFTVIGYLAYHKMHTVDNAEAQRLGKQATTLSQREGYSIGKATDPRYGQVNTYHENILARILPPTLGIQV